MEIHGASKQVLVIWLQPKDARRGLPWIQEMSETPGSEFLGEWGYLLRFLGFKGKLLGKPPLPKWCGPRFGGDVKGHQKATTILWRPKERGPEFFCFFPAGHHQFSRYKLSSV